VSQMEVSGGRRRKPPAILAHGRPCQKCGLAKSTAPAYFGLMATMFGGAAEPSDFLKLIGT
jgi:hypothetical protein